MEDISLQIMSSRNDCNTFKLRVYFPLFGKKVVGTCRVYSEIRSGMLLVAFIMLDNIKFSDSATYSMGVTVI